MTRAELDANGLWTIPGSRTKNSRTHSLTLPPLAQQIINSLPVIQSCPYVFTTNGRSPVSGFSKAKDKLDAVTGQLPAWVLHDLRRTAASGMAALGVQLPVIEKVLNHISGSFGGIVSVYQKHEFAAEKAEALARWAQHVHGLVEGRANVVAMRPR